MTILSRIWSSILSMFRRKPAPKCVDCVFCFGPSSSHPICGHASAQRTDKNHIRHDRHWHEYCAFHREDILGARPARTALRAEGEDMSDYRPKIYVASRASIEERPAMWRKLRESGWRIVSSWIDEAGPGQTKSWRELWERIHREILMCDGLILYAEESDLPLNGALVEAGIALGCGKPVAFVFGKGDFLERPSMRPIGTWLNHPECEVFSSLEDASQWIANGMPK